MLNCLPLTSCSLFLLLHSFIGFPGGFQVSSRFEHRSDPNRLLLCVEETCRGTRGTETLRNMHTDREDALAGSSGKTSLRRWLELSFRRIQEHFPWKRVGLAGTKVLLLEAVWLPREVRAAVRVWVSVAKCFLSPFSFEEPWAQSQRPAHMN